MMGGAEEGQKKPDAKSVAPGQTTKAVDDGAEEEHLRFSPEEEAVRLILSRLIRNLIALLHIIQSSSSSMPCQVEMKLHYMLA
jgi:hypothetical protein